MLFRDSTARKIRWQLRKEIVPSPALEEVARKHSLHPVIVRLLAQRVTQDQHGIVDFLNPSLANLPEPLLMSGMAQAVMLASEAVIKKIPIIIWGDYDVDGTTGTALLVRFFRDLGADVSYFIPDRISQGYGLHLDKLEIIAQNHKREKLLITVDCGISSIYEIQEAKKMGFKVIVTDHHLPPNAKIPAEAVLNPKQRDCKFPADCLAGVAVAFYLACGIRQHLRKRNFFRNDTKEPDVSGLLDLVAIGTLADMVPLDHVNRALVREGLRRIEIKQRPGVGALLEVSGILDNSGNLIGKISSEDIGFLIGPAINAAGRMESATIAVELLLSESMERARILASKLVYLNDIRKKIVHSAFENVVAEIGTRELRRNVVIARGQYHHGVVGIVASRIVAKFNLPVILFAEEKDAAGKIMWRGSGRSIQGIDLHKALCGCGDVIERYGGHAMAAGVVVSDERFNEFSQMMNDKINEQMVKIDDDVLYDKIDLPVEIHDIFSNKFLQQLQLLEPFGQENNPPVFSAKNFYLTDIRETGSDKSHLSLVLKAHGATIRGMGFGLGHLGRRLREEKNATIVYTPMVNRFKEKHSWEARVIDVYFEEKYEEGSKPSIKHSG